MNWQKLRDGLFVDFDKIAVVEFEAAESYNKQEKELDARMVVNGILESGAKIPLMTVVLKDTEEKSIKAAVKECEAFVSEYFIKADKKAR